MKILIVGVVSGAQVERVREEAGEKGHSVEGCYVKQLTVTSDKNGFHPSLREKPLEDFDLIYLLTAGGTRRWMWNAAIEYLAQEKGTIIVNRHTVDPNFHYNPNVLKEYLLLSKHGITYPKTVTISSIKSLDFLITQLSFPFIVKSGEGRKGKSVFKVENKDELSEVLSDLEKAESTIVAREFIPNDGDIRVFCIGYKAVGAMFRTPKEGDFRSNVSQGGTAVQYDLNANPKVKEIAERAAEVTRTEIAGVDVMIHKETGEPYILEVNPGPQFVGIESTGINVVEKIVLYFEQLLDKNH